MKYEVPGVDDRDVWNVYLAPIQAAAVYAADEVGLFARLAEAPGSPSEIAERTGLGLRALEAVLALLAAQGFLTVHDGRYRPNVAGRAYMTPGSPFYWGPVWKNRRRRSSETDFIVEALRDADTKKSDLRPWEAPEMSAEAAQMVADRMNAHSMPAALGVARQYPFGGIRRLLDVGGGGGCYSIAFAQHHPALSCTVMDLPAMCEVLDRTMAAEGMSGRVDALSRNMFMEDWPAGYDAIFMSNVLHDWDDRRCADLLVRAFAALPSGGQVMLHEQLLDDGGAGPLVAAAFSVQMLGTYGKQRTLAQLADLLTAAGFADVDVVPTSIFFSVVSARKP